MDTAIMTAGFVVGAALAVVGLSICAAAVRIARALEARKEEA